ncbi:MAG: hypothetical protein GQ553_04570 [Nitrosomonadaceae bacterium]|nr:hypothetical protein [Nitrosomonadaceae bacterium]
MQVAESQCVLRPVTFNQPLPRRDTAMYFLKSVQQTLPAHARFQLAIDLK